MVKQALDVPLLVENAHERFSRSGLGLVGWLHCIRLRAQVPSGCPELYWVGDDGLSFKGALCSGLSHRVSCAEAEQRSRGSILE